MLTPWTCGSFLTAPPTSMAIQHDAGGEQPKPTGSLVRRTMLRLEGD